MTIQERVAAAVAARGYREGWTAEQFAARQVCKLVEELAELSQVVEADTVRSYAYEEDLDQLGIDARKMFDDETAWGWAGVQDIAAARAELADIQVVVFTLAAALNEIDGEQWDVAQAALDKALADMGRDVR